MKSLEEIHNYLESCHNIPTLPRGWRYVVTINRNVTEGELAPFAEVKIAIFDVNGVRSCGRATRGEKFLNMYPWSMDTDIEKAARIAYHNAYPKDTVRLTELEGMLK